MLSFSQRRSGGSRNEELDTIFRDVIITENLRESEQDRIVCNVCQEGEEFLGDEIVLCEICAVAVHQSCYGSELIREGIPKSEWVCMRCSYARENKILPETINCRFCPEVRGVLKQINNNYEWAHVACVNWIPEIWFKKEREREDVDMRHYYKWREVYCCHLCGRKKGAIIMCDFIRCQEKFHISCAIRLGLISSWKEMSDLKRKIDTDV